MFQLVYDQNLLDFKALGFFSNSCACPGFAGSWCPTNPPLGHNQVQMCQVCKKVS